ncbi:G5 domain-containing protein [Kribbella sp. NPDC055071]
MPFIRAALASAALLVVGAGCGPSSGTTDVADPPASVATITKPTSTPTSTPTTPTTPPTTAATPTIEPPTTTKPAIVKPITTKTRVFEYRTIPFKKKTVTDDSMPKGEKTIRTAGVDGTRKLTYEITWVNGVQKAKRLVRQDVSKQPTTQVTAVGTQVEETESSGCDPNYSGCVPIASDVDCSGGSGNGPEYVAGPVEVIGSDIYGLDRDHDGIGCED